MKKSIFILSLLAVLSLGFTACEGLLDIPQHGVTGVDDYYKTDSDANEAIATVYNQWATMELQYIYMTGFPSDDVYAGGKNRGANIPIEGLSDYTYDENNTQMTNFFTNLYRIVYRCNALLDNFKEPSSGVQKQAVAEAHFFRAWAYFYLTVLWGTPPKADHVLQPDEYVLPNTPREGEDGLWAFIESDLKAAISSGALAKKSNANDVQVRITESAAQAFLGKVYVFEAKWSDARTTLDGVINSGKYDLFKGNYGNILQMEGEWSCESVLETNIVADLNNKLGGSTYVSIGWRGEQFNWTGKGDTDIATQGWGQSNPTRDLYDAFVAHGEADSYRRKNTIWTYDEVLEHGITIRPGQTLEQHDGIFAWKQRYSEAGKLGGAMNHQVNFHYMRFAEVLLLAAEAHLQAGGDASKALDYVNRIRTRAQIPALASVTMDDLKIEKRLELCFEGCRFMDLVRWGDAPKVLAEKGKNIGTFTCNQDGSTTWNPKGFTYTTGGFQTNRHELFPFPRTETMVNTLIEQNPGWTK